MGNVIKVGWVFKDPLYVCDPMKNADCKGRVSGSCGNTCFCTVDPNKSKDPTNKITTEAKYNSEWNKILKSMKGEGNDKDK